MRTYTIIRLAVSACIVLGFFYLTRSGALYSDGTRDFLNGLGSEKNPFTSPDSSPASIENLVEATDYDVAQNQTEAEPAPALKPNFTAAGNATLGFEKIFYINLPSRYDCADVMAMQQDMCGLEIEYLEAVDAHTLNDKGLPPSSNFKSQMNLGRLGCWRSHASVWQKMLSEKWTTVMVLESDATWDLNLRNITERLAEGLHEFINNGKFNLSRTTKLPTDNDPYNSAQWDYLAIGACMESERNSEIYFKYPDSDSPDSTYSFDGEVVDTLKDERIIRKSGGPICTNAYAVSRTGARKMLLRSAIDLNTAVDLMINELVREGDMVAYTPFPPLIYQWNYRGGIGADSQNSDITESEEEKPREKKLTPEEKKIWEDARLHHKVWSVNGMFGKYPFKHWVIDYFSPYAFPHLYDPVKKAEKEKQELEYQEKEAKKKAAKEKAAKEQAEKEKEVKVKEELEKAEKAAAELREKFDKEVKEKEAKAKAEQEEKDKEAKAKAEQEQKDKEMKDKAEQEQKEKEAKAKAEQEQKDQEAKAKAEQEQKDQEAKAKTEADKAETENSNKP